MDLLDIGSHDFWHGFDAHKIFSKLMNLQGCKMIFRFIESLGFYK